jgi:ketosteroid isomerase-like protein
MPLTTEPAAGLQEIDVVRRHLAAYNRRDLDTLRELSHPEVELDWSASKGTAPGVYRGVDAVLAFHADFFDTFTSVVIAPQELTAAGDAVLMPNVALMRGRDAIAVSARSTLAFTVRGGRVTRIRLCA